MEEPVPRELPIEHPYVQPTLFPRCLKEQKGNLCKICEAICMIGISEMTHKEKTQMDNGCDIMVKDVEKLRQMLTPTMHTLSNLELVMQPYGVMRPLTLQTGHITPLDDVAPATSLILDKHLNEFGEEFSNITRVAKKEDGNLVNNVKELSDIIKTYAFETFIQKLLHQEEIENLFKKHRIWTQKQANMDSQDVLRCNHPAKAIVFLYLSLTLANSTTNTISFANTMHQRIFSYIPHESSSNIKAKRSSTEAIHLLRSLMENYRERERDLHMAFLDMEKAYDKVLCDEVDADDSNADDGTLSDAGLLILLRLQLVAAELFQEHDDDDDEGEDIDMYKELNVSNLPAL
nr:putative alpha,alpha-trehalose-phosphate synthase [UDP-forming] 8 [Tanacetum cinerariifolium]